MEQNLIIQLLDGVEGNKIDNVRISGKELKKAGLPESTCSNLLKKLFEAMKNNSSVKKIRLNGSVPGLNDETIACLSSAMAVNSTVVLLTIEYGNCITVAGARSLAQMLGANQSIKDFRVGGNAFGDDGLAALLESWTLYQSHLDAQVLPLKTKMTYFSVDKCDISDIGASNMATALRKLTLNGGHLRNLDFENNPKIASGGTEAIVRSMLDCGVKPNKYTSEGAQTILAKMQQVDQKEQAEQKSAVLDRLDNASARAMLVKLQREMIGLVASFVRESGRGVMDADRHKACVSKLQTVRSSCLHLVAAEVARIGRLTNDRTKFYALVSLRWDCLKQIAMNNESTTPHVQPPMASALNTLSVSAFLQTSSSVGSQVSLPTETENSVAIMMARVNAQTLCAYFSQSLSEIVETLNNAKSIKDLDLPRANLDFRSDLKGNRCQLLIGPIKRAARAAVKSAEYNAEIRSGIKPAQTSAGRKLSGVDYVLDWLRASLCTDDPYVLFVVFLLIQKRSHTFRLQRVKNKFFDKDEPMNIRTNALLNLLLLYPPDKASYARAPLDLMGPWNKELAGMPLTSCELQLTLTDFVTIKRLMHKYYNIERSEDTNYMIRNPVFMDTNNLEEIVPAVLQTQTV